jgi:hypothetical protein
MKGGIPPLSVNTGLPAPQDLIDVIKQMERHAKLIVVAATKIAYHALPTVNV